MDRCINVRALRFRQSAKEEGGFASDCTAVRKAIFYSHSGDGESQRQPRATSPLRREGWRGGDVGSAVIEPTDPTVPPGGTAWVRRGKGRVRVTYIFLWCKW